MNIRNTYFQPRNSDLGIELLTIESLFERYLPNALEKPERLHFYLIILYTAGAGRHWIDFVPHDYNPLTLMFVSEGQVQQFQRNPETRGFLLLFTPEFLHTNATALNLAYSLQIFDAAMQRPYITLSPDQHDAFVRRFREIAQEMEHAEDTLREEMLRHLLRLVLFQAERLYRHADERKSVSAAYQDFVSFRVLVRQHLTQQHTADFYATELSVSVRQLNRLTIQVLGKTAKAYIESQLILEIQRFLSQENIAVKEIAYTLGFRTHLKIPIR